MPPNKKVAYKQHDLEGEGWEDFVKVFLDGKGVGFASKKAKGDKDLRIENEGLKKKLKSVKSKLTKVTNKNKKLEEKIKKLEEKIDKLNKYTRFDILDFDE
jgi:septal ring factor EnvC (AmiA/AmiB activator)